MFPVSFDVSCWQSGFTTSAWPAVLAFGVARGSAMIGAVSLAVWAATAGRWDVTAAMTALCLTEILALSVGLWRIERYIRQLVVGRGEPLRPEDGPRGACNSAGVGGLPVCPDMGLRSSISCLAWNHVSTHRPASSPGRIPPIPGSTIAPAARSLVDLVEVSDLAKHLLLTGVTGQVGQYLIRDLLLAGQTLTVLVRPRGIETPQARVDAILRRWESELGTTLPRPACVAGNITEPGLGVKS